MSLHIHQTRIKPKAGAAKIVDIFLGMAAGVLVAAFAAYALQIMH